MTSLLTLTVMILFAGSVCGETVWSPEHFWKQDSEYAGGRSCQPCHSEIYKMQEASGHSRSLRPLEDVPEIIAQLPFETFDRVSGAKLILRRNEEGRVDLIGRNDAGEEKMTLEWAFGSGARGITPIGRLVTGDFVESRLTWYASRGSFDFTTGAAKHEPRTLNESLGRALSGDEVTECLGCHSTGGIPKPSIRSVAAMGIRCERCHGPGQAHTQAMKRGPTAEKLIFHPKTLDGFAQAQMCGVCHGRPPEDADLRAIVAIQNAPNTVRFPSPRLVLSRCFNETFGGIRCSTCHDPHTSNQAADSRQDRICSSCHEAGARLRVKVCTVAKNKCSSCHMPKERVMAHSLFTDHWIRVVRK